MIERGHHGGEEAPAPNAEAVRRARTFWEQSRDDLKEARRLMRGKAWLESSYFSFQASLNALTAVCYLHGEYRVPNFSAVQLAALCEGLDARFGGLQAQCTALEEVQERGPFDPERDAKAERELSRSSYAHGSEVLRTVRGYLKEHRRRFFAP